MCLCIYPRLSVYFVFEIDERHTENEVSMDVAEVVYTLIRLTYIMDEPNFFLQMACYDTATQEVYFPKFIEQNTPKKCTVHFSDYLKIVITSQGTITLQAS